MGNYCTFKQELIGKTLLITKYTVFVCLFVTDRHKTKVKQDNNWNKN